jgi:hypothetical protein
MFFTLADARPVVAPFVRGGTCADAEAVRDRVNECVRRLIVKQSVAGVVKWMRFSTTNNSITLPRGCQRIVGNPTIDGTPRRLFNQAYEFLERGPGEICAAGGTTGKDLLDLGTGWPTFFDIPSDACRYLVAFSTAAADATLTMKVAGRDQYNAELLVDGQSLPSFKINQWAGGVEGSIVNAADLVYSAQQFKSISAVYKPKTQGQVSLYTYEPATGRMYFLAKYHPYETQPSFHRYRILLPDFTNGNNIMLRVKLGYVPMVDDTDVLIIQNLDAIKLMAQAISKENESKVDEAMLIESQAVRLLVEQSGDESEKDFTLHMIDTTAAPGGCTGFTI